MLFNAENNCRKLSELSDFFVLRLFCWPFCPFCFPKTSRKFFPIIGKIGPNFPTIGKKFSNHWKVFFKEKGDRPQIGPAPRAHRFSTQRTGRKEHKAGLHKKYFSVAPRRAFC
jgi:hypothetical protein